MDVTSEGHQPAASAVLRDAESLIGPALHSAVVRLDPANRHVARYHLGFIDATGQATDGAGGKGIRGTLALLSARAVGTGGSGDPDRAGAYTHRAGASDDRGVPAAIAVELIHSYSLLHDDIIDEDETRRHRPAAWTVFGPEAAILAGDAMAALATEILAEIGTSSAALAARDLAVATRRMLAGQAADIAFEDRPEVGLDECRRMVEGKTGALLACAASLGARLVGADESVVFGLEDFGRHVAMAFQLIDDLLGIWGAGEVTGKPVASDLASRKKSLPVVAALEAGGPDADRLRAIYADTGPLSVEQLAAAAAAVEGAGGRSWAQAEAERETAAALAVLDTVAIDDEVRAQLRVLAEMLCRRDH